MDGIDNCHLESPTCPPGLPFQDPLWRSIWLHRKTLVGFATLFTLIWIALIILWRYSLLNNGIAIALTTNHYAWTYSPTIIITVITSLWRRVDYHCKLAQPWKEMKRGSVDSSKGLLLDYISPIPITTLYRAFRNHHWGTASSVLTLALLQAAMLLSTVLLVSVQTSGSYILPLTVTSKFNGSEFWDGVLGLAANGSGQVYENDLVTVAYVWDAPELIFAYQGINNNEVKEPPGLQNDVVFQILDIPSVTNNLTQVSATIGAFVPNITCEQSVLTFGDSIRPWQRAIALDTPTCSAGHFADTLWTLVCDQNCPSYNETFNMIRVNCSEADDAAENLENLGKVPITKYTPYDLRFALIAINSTNTEVTNFDNNGTATPNKTWIVTPTQSAAVLCKFDYNIQNLTSTMDLTADSIQIHVPDHSESSSPSLNLTGIELGEFIFALLHHPNAARDLVTTIPHGYPMGPGLVYNAEVLANIATNVYSGLAAQLIHQKWTIADNTSINGTGVYYENRLHIQPIALWSLVSVFILMSCLPLLMAFSMTGAVAPVDPGSVAALATILASSPSLQHLLARAGSLRTSEMKKWLDGYIFKSGFDSQGRFQLVTTGSPPLYHKLRAAQRVGNGSDLTPEHMKVKKGNWVPLAARYYFLSFAFLLPISTVIALEALYQVSQHNHGLIQADYTALPYIQYATSLVLVIITVTFNGIDFTIQSLSPFHALSTRQKIAGRGVLDNFLDKLPPVALYHAVRNRYFGAALSTTSTTIGSVLAIVSSGLWVVRSSLPIVANVQTSPGTTWDLGWNNSVIDDSGASVLLNSIDLNATTSPEGTWGDLAFPDLHVIDFPDETGKSRFSSTDPAGSPHFTFTLPALRPVLACDTVPEKNIHLRVLNFTDTWNDPNAANILYSIDTIIDLPKGCHGGPTGDRNYLWLNDSLTTANREPCWRGSLYDGANTGFNSLTFRSPILKTIQANSALY